MNPHPLFCANNACPSRGQIDAGNIGPHDGLKDRWKCRTCGKTFTENKGSVYHRLKTDDQTVTPPDSARLAGAINVPIQSVCPGQQISHSELPTNPVVTKIVLQAISAGPIRHPASADCRG